MKLRIRDMDTSGCRLIREPPLSSDKRALVSITIELILNEEAIEAV